jgi:hypothetical protein
LPFLPLFDFVSGTVSSQTLNSSRFAGMIHLIFGVMGGKNGTIAARKWQHVARWAAKTARMGKDVAVSTRGRMRLRRDEVGMVASIMRLFRRERRRVAPCE